MTWYLKYRPQKISQLDLTVVREHLRQVLAKKDLPHAWLFAGPRGTGKTSAARILAKAINCVGPRAKGQGLAGEPCNECEMCAAITLGSALDVVEIDAASNRGIDEIRDLRDKIKLAPLAAKYKVYIVDEAHMLTPEAFNALLKTLEEPPAHAVFVLCTTEMEKLPQTVVSRCMVVKFQRPSLAEIVKKLEKVASGEKLKMDDRQLTMIAQAAKGSFRDAIKILEQVALSGQSVEQVLGMLETADPKEFVTFLRSGQTQKSLAMINDLVEQGVNLRGFIERCVEVVREELLGKWGDDPLRTNLVGLIEAFEKVYVRTRDTAVPQLPLEILVIENSRQDITPKEEGDTSPQRGFNLNRRSERGTPSGKLADVEAKWVEILKAVRPKNHSVEALLRSTRPIDWDGQTLSLEVFYKFHKDKLETDRCRVMIEEAVGQILGTDGVRLSLRLGQRTKKEEVSAEAIEEDIIKVAEEIFKVEAI